MSYVIGVDIGGTNTDVAILNDKTVIGWCKSLTQEHVISGVITSILKAVENCEENGYSNVLQSVKRVHIGSTHLINAVIKRKRLSKVACIRLCGLATQCLPPLCDFPEDLIEHVDGTSYLLDGGYEYNGKLINKVNDIQVIETLDAISISGVKHVAVTGVFSPNFAEQEEHVGRLIDKYHPELTYTLSHTLGNYGLLDRENTTILNESLRDLCFQTNNGFKRSLADIGLSCPLYFTQNDGTLISEKDTLKYPVLTFSSGATNSMRGAAYLADIKNAIIVDIGGTSTDIGVLVNSFPRESSTRIKIGGVNTKFRMPDTVSIGLGGGSHVKLHDNKVLDVGPDSVEYNIKRDAYIFGGNTLVATDIAVAAGLSKFGDKNKVDGLSKQFVTDALSIIKNKLECTIDRVKTTQESWPVVLVGGGSILVDDKQDLTGVSKILKPPFFQVANAVGAALGQISGTYSNIVTMTDSNSQQIIDDAKRKAIEKAVQNGAVLETCTIVDVKKSQISYVGLQKFRLIVKAVGDLDIRTNIKEKDTQFQTDSFVDGKEQETQPMKTTLAIKEDSIASKKLQSRDECFPVIKSGEWYLSLWDAQCLTIGAGILGCGGGGSPYLGSIRLQQCIKQGAIPRVVHPESLNKDDVVYCVAFMGAPLIYTEMLPQGSELINALNLSKYVVDNGLADHSLTSTELTNLADKLDVKVEVMEDGKTLYFTSNKPLTGMKKPSALLCCEVGGLNMAEPLILAASLDVPVLDCDGMGRAFPELQQFAPFIYGCPAYPAVITSLPGRAVCCIKNESATELEGFFRNFCVEFGCIAGVCIAALSKDDILKYTIPNTISKARYIGNSVLNACRLNSSPVQALVNEMHGKLICEGKVLDVLLSTGEGFGKGHVVVKSTDTSKEDVMINFQNEYLISKELSTSKIIATTPDLITIVATETGEPVTTDEIKYGLRVSVIVFASAPLMNSARALKFTGPKAFNYDVDYVSIGGFVQVESLTKH